MADKRISRYKNAVKKLCPVCGLPFLVRPDRSKQKTCSRLCAAVGRRRRVLHSCEHCGKEFWEWPSTKKEIRFCTQRCRTAALNPKIKYACAICQTEFFEHHCRNPRITCGRACHLERVKRERLERQRTAPQRESARKRAIHAQLRRDVVAGYGGRCECCGESEIYFLSIDHIHKDAHRDRHPSGRKIGGTSLYRILIRKGFPRDRYQLLCFNCNCAKGFFGICPHQVKKLQEASGIPRLLVSKGRNRRLPYSPDQGNLLDVFDIRV